MAFDKQQAADEKGGPSDNPMNLHGKAAEDESESKSDEEESN
ncbi:MAG TPA: hypothetical protein VFL13_03455 [Candidatus Baltobacteraceae bacterium]|nr:hypothetical protein [Candidatus Baltobacteraceae bacterium]